VIGKPKNRRKQTEGGGSSAWQKLPKLNWKRIGMTFASLAGVGAAAVALVWSLDQPIDQVTVNGRFARVSAADVERAVKQKVRNVGLVSVDLETVRYAIEQIPWVDSVTVQRAWPHGRRLLDSKTAAPKTLDATLIVKSDRRVVTRDGEVDNAKASSVFGSAFDRPRVRREDHQRSWRRTRHGCRVSAQHAIDHADLHLAWQQVLLSASNCRQQTRRAKQGAP